MTWDVSTRHAFAVRDVVEVAEGRLGEVQQLVQFVAAVALQPKGVEVDRAAPHQMRHPTLVC
eukprot:7388623-Prymnesium_polylepis.1